MNPLRFNKRVILSIQHKSDIQNLNKFRTCLRIIFTTFVKNMAKRRITQVLAITQLKTIL